MLTFPVISIFQLNFVADIPFFLSWHFTMCSEEQSPPSPASLHLAFICFFKFYDTWNSIFNFFLLIQVFTFALKLPTTVFYYSFTLRKNYVLHLGGTLFVFLAQCIKNSKTSLLCLHKNNENFYNLISPLWFILLFCSKVSTKKMSLAYKKMKRANKIEIFLLV